MAHEVIVPEGNVVKLRRIGVTVTSVEPGSLAEDMGFEAGDRILKVNDRRIRDVIDWRYYTSGETDLAVAVEKADGELWDLDVEIDEGDDWGLEFETMMPRQCANDCIFCFIKQNPADARKPLFIKDEDIRLSFLHGNYTTMTSLTRAEFDRIVEQRLSPQYVSVHATDPELRRYMLGRKTPDDILGTIRRLVERGIDIHAQIVLCPGINDGEQLRRTVFELSSLHPGVVSAAIVPLGMSELHAEREKLTPATPEWCASVIDVVRPWQREFRRTIGSTFAFLGDEFYLLAGRPLPSARHYGEYPQIEDGVGMVRRFQRGLERALVDAAPLPGHLRHGTLATGRLFAGPLEQAARLVNARLDSSLCAIGVTNTYFGEEITVAGLVSGRCFLAARDRIVGDFLVIPKDALRSHDCVFIDGMHPDDLERELGIPVYDSDTFLAEAGLADADEAYAPPRESYPQVPFQW
jgi:putative radical SAM enzyme (TIGR03279 family)